MRASGAHAPGVLTNNPGTRLRHAQTRSEESRSAIIAAAMKLFAERGFDGVTLRDIATESARPLGVVSYHFKSKDALWRCAAAAIHQTIEDHFRKRIEGLAGVDAETCARLMLREYCRYFAKNPNMFRFMIHLGMAPSEHLTWYVENFGRPFRSQFDTVFKELARQNGIKEHDPRFAALLYTIFGGATLFYAVAAEVQLTTGVDPTDPTIIESHTDLVLKLFMSKAGAEGAKQRQR
jgi:AcrR family transcriptional regulator